MDLALLCPSFTVLDPPPANGSRPLSAILPSELHHVAGVRGSTTTVYRRRPVPEPPCPPVVTLFLSGLPLLHAGQGEVLSRHGGRQGFASSGSGGHGLCRLICCFPRLYLTKKMATVVATPRAPRSRGSSAGAKVGGRKDGPKCRVVLPNIVTAGHFVHIASAFDR
ncbi:uncharacterized protein [Triticum aestivum]|uniref:uncharacterized protein n=1 Tax=Triticum aestivum TaxID=4565 RepID=UPI001D0068B9|nr:uncharacterized protein LOC123157194 [Triticum aestivum]